MPTDADNGRGQTSPNHSSRRCPRTQPEPGRPAVDAGDRAVKRYRGQVAAVASTVTEAGWRRGNRAADGAAPGAWRGSVEHRGGGAALRVAVGCGELGVDDEPVAVLGEQMAHEAQRRGGSRGLAEQPRLGIGHRSVGVVAAPPAAPVRPGVAAAARRPPRPLRLLGLLGLELRRRGPGCGAGSGFEALVRRPPMAASSRACQVVSSIMRCWGSSIWASIGEMRKNSASNWSKSSMNAPKRRASCRSPDSGKSRP